MFSRGIFSRTEILQTRQYHTSIYRRYKREWPGNFPKGASSRAKQTNWQREKPEGNPALLVVAVLLVQGCDENVGVNEHDSGEFLIQTGCMGVHVPVQGFLQRPPKRILRPIQSPDRFPILNEFLEFSSNPPCRPGFIEMNLSFTLSHYRGMGPRANV